MSQLKSILEAVVEKSDKAGGGALSLNAIAGLEAYRRKQFSIFVAVEVAIVIAVACCAWYLVSNPGPSATAKALAGLVGIGSGGGVEVARRIWKDWARTDLILVLIAEASEAQVNALIDRLIKAL